MSAVPLPGARAACRLQTSYFCVLRVSAVPLPGGARAAYVSVGIQEEDSNAALHAVFPLLGISTHGEKTFNVVPWPLFTRLFVLGVICGTALCSTATPSDDVLV